MSCLSSLICSARCSDHFCQFMSHQLPWGVPAGTSRSARRAVGPAGTRRVTGAAVTRSRTHNPPSPPGECSAAILFAPIVQCLERVEHGVEVPVFEGVEELVDQVPQLGHQESPAEAPHGFTEVTAAE